MPLEVAIKEDFYMHLHLLTLSYVYISIFHYHLKKNLGTMGDPGTYESLSDSGAPGFLEVQRPLGARRPLGADLHGNAKSIRTEGGAGSSGVQGKRGQGLELFSPLPDL
jgi:hypothetical protein